MKNSIFMALMFTAIAFGTMANAENNNRRDNRSRGNYDNNERRGGMFGNGGILGTGVGRDRRHDYYENNNSYRSSSRRNDRGNKSEKNVKSNSGRRTSK
jgi:hypothetical protein